MCRPNPPFSPPHSLLSNPPLLSLPLSESTFMRAHTYTRTDKYGNYISTDPKEFPDGSERIEFEYCMTLGSGCQEGSLESCICNGGVKSTNVAIEVQYAKGPNGTTVNGKQDGKPYLGLYQITYFPFAAESSTPLIRHNFQYIQCYFDMGEDPVGIQDPEEDARQCVMDRIVEKANRDVRSMEVTPVSKPSPSTAKISFRMRSDDGKISDADPPQPRSSSRLHVTERLEIAQAGVQEKEPFVRRTSGRRADGADKNSAFDPLQGGFAVDVENTFTAPNVEQFEFYLQWSPFMCAGIALFLTICTAVPKVLENRKKKDYLHETLTPSQNQMKHACAELENPSGRTEQQQHGSEILEVAAVEQSIAANMQVMPALAGDWTPPTDDDHYKFAQQGLTRKDVRKAKVSCSIHAHV